MSFPCAERLREIGALSWCFPHTHQPHLFAPLFLKINQQVEIYTMRHM